MYKNSDQKGVKLIKELKSSSVFPEYNKVAIKQICNDINNVFNHMTEKIDKIQTEELPQSHPDAASAVFDTLRVERQKVYIYAYLNERCNRLQKYYWQNESDLPEHIKQTLSNEEIDYFNNYIKSLSEYTQDAVKCK